MDTNKGLFSNNYKVPAPIPVPETAMGWVVRGESSAEVTESESSSKSPASVRKSKAAANGASQRHPGSAWNAKVRELNAKVAEVLGQSYLNLFDFTHATAYDSQLKLALFSKDIRKHNSISLHGQISLYCCTRRA